MVPTASNPPITDLLHPLRRHIGQPSRPSPTRATSTARRLPTSHPPSPTSAPAIAPTFPPAPHFPGLHSTPSPMLDLMAVSKKSRPPSSKPSTPAKSPPHRATRAAPVPTPAPTPDITEPSDAEPEYTLPVLLARTGPATRDEALAHLGAYDPDALVVRGRRADTARISRDARRLYGRALDFHARATPAQRVGLGAVTPDRLRVGVWASCEGDRLDAELTSGAGTAQKSQANTRAKWTQLRATALKRRELLRATASAWLGDNPAVDDAFGTSRTAAEIATSLRALSTLVRGCLTSAKPAMRALTRGTALTADWLDAVDALADEVRKVGTSAESTRVAATVSQGEVDLWDGINLTLLERLIDAFDAAHAEDAAVPRLIPMSLRSLLARSHRAPPAAPPVTPPVA